MREYAHARLIAEVKSLALFFYSVYRAQALHVVLEAAGIYGVERPFARVAEGRVPEIVPQGYGLGKIFVEAERAGYRPGDAGYLESMREPCSVVIPLRAQEYLSLMLEPAEGFGLCYSVYIPVEAGPHGAWLLLPLPAL